MPEPFLFRFDKIEGVALARRLFVCAVPFQE
jgi:hypothetical protein